MAVQTSWLESRPVYARCERLQPLKPFYFTSPRTRLSGRSAPHCNHSRSVFLCCHCLKFQDSSTMIIRLLFRVDVPPVCESRSELVLNCRSAKATKRRSSLAEPATRTRVFNRRSGDCYEDPVLRGFLVIKRPSPSLHSAEIRALKLELLRTRDQIATAKFTLRSSQALLDSIAVWRGLRNRTGKIT